jgi:hypothetical protein
MEADEVKRMSGRNHGRKQWRRHGGSDTAADRWGPHGLIIIKLFQN